MNDPSASDGSNEEVTKTPETEIRRKSASPLVNFTLDLGASCEANVCIPREDDSEFEDESMWDEEWDEEVTEEEEDEEGCPSNPATNSAALNSVFWDMLDSDIRQELDIRKEILSATRVADGNPVLENGTSSSSQELNETFTVRLRDSSTPVPEDSDENTAEFVMSNYSRREGSPMPDTEAASTSFTMRMGLVWLGSSKPPGSKSKPMGLPLPRTPPGGKATPTTANHSVAASKAQTADFDSSSGTSDGSINISKATKGIEETLRLDGKVLNNLLDEQYRPSPKKASSPTKKPPRQPLINYPRFYYPQGQPVSSVVNDSALRRVCEVFKAFPNQQCEIDDMFEVCQAAGLPLYWKAPIFAALTKNEPRPATLMDFTVWWRAMTSVAHDEASRFVYTLTGGTKSHLLPADFHSLVMDIIHTHPGLGFYREAVEFHDKYRDVVVTRIFWNVARNWSGKITTEEIRKSDLLQAIRELQLDDDINKSLRYFSYEHFYVVYCKFFDLDTDHDMKIDRDDLATHSDGAIVPLVVERIFSGAVCRIARRKDNVEQIGLVEFTQFLLAEEDKAHRTSIEYWFRILDQDGDGVVTLYDMEKFHEQIQKKLAERNIDSMAFKDVACQLIDMIGSGCTSSFRLKDLKASKLRARFINSFVNWHKFYTQETNEGSESARIEDESGQELSEWDRYCMEEYEQILEHDEAETISVNLDDEDRPTMTFHDLL